MSRNKFLKNMMTYGVLSTIPILSSTAVANADGNLEVEFENTINKYNEEDVIVENGIAISKNETLDLSQYSGWELSNNETVEIDENGILIPIKEGTVFLSNQINTKVHVIEVYVSDNSTSFAAYSNTKSTTVNRNYYKVFIDPGHGGSDNGASGFGYLEDELNLQVSKIVESKLKQKGIEVKMSRTSDTYLSLSQRATMANNYGADVFVSIHQNASEVESANGIETYYHTNKVNYKPLSNEIQTAAINETGAKNRGVKNGNFTVISQTTMPSSLFESGFISNGEESKKLSNPVYQDKLASGIANAIEKYLKENIKLSGNDTSTPDIPEEDVINTGVVTASSLNIRSGAGTTYSKIGSLSKGAKVEIVGQNSGWYKIKYNGGYGYASADYIDINQTTLPPTTPDEPNEEIIKTGIVTTSSLNVRSGYGTSYSKIGSLSKGAKVEIVDSKSGWYKIKYNNGYGYVSSEYIDTNSNSNSGSNSGTTVIETGIVTTSSLNVRSGYGTSYSKIGSLSKGAKVEIVESKSGWYKIKYNNGYGYVSSEYIDTNSNSNSGSNSGTTVIETGIVTTSSLNVRSGYGTSYSKIGSLSKGAKVEIVESKSGWYKIKYNSGYGYVSSEYIDTNSNSNSGSNGGTAVIKTGVVTTPSLNVRSGYGTSYSKIGSLSKGVKVEIVESKSGWYKIKYNNGYGHVSSEYIQ